VRPGHAGIGPVEWETERMNSDVYESLKVLAPHIDSRTSTEQPLRMNSRMLFRVIDELKHRVKEIEVK
jgi:hypothetical protein